MLKGKNLPLELWGEAVNTCIYVLNMSATKSLKGKTLYEMWCGRKPTIEHLRVFGSMVYVKTNTWLSKLEDRGRLMIFIGYEVGTKAYRCLDPLTFKVYINRDVIFKELEAWDFSKSESQ